MSSGDLTSEELEEFIQFLTGIPEVDFNILNNLSDQDLGIACQVNSYTNSLCQDDYLWEIRSKSRYNVTKKPTKISWREYYQLLPYYSKEANAISRAVGIDDLIESANYPILNILLRVVIDKDYIYGRIIFLNRLNVLEGLKNLDLFQPHNPTNLANRAARLRRINFLDWLAEQKIYPSESTFISTFSTFSPEHDFPLIEWFYQHGYNFSITVQRRNIRDPETENWLQQHGVTLV